MGRGPRLHAHFFGRLRAAQGNGAVFRMAGYGRHRRQWVKKVKKFSADKHEQQVVCNNVMRCMHLTGSFLKESVEQYN